LLARSDSEIFQHVVARIPVNMIHKIITRRAKEGGSHRPVKQDTLAP
jgi:hypothetical protein